MILSRLIGSISGARLSPVIAGTASSGSPATPTVTTSTSSEAVREMTLSGTFSGPTTSRYFEHGASAGSLNSTLSMSNTSTSALLDGLSDNQTRHFRAVAENANYTRTISGTINPNFYSTQLSLIWGTSPTLAGATTTVIGTYTGSTAQAFSVNRSSVADTTYYYRIVATNIFTEVQTSILSYSESPAVANGATRSQTTAAAQPTPSIVWESEATNSIGPFRLYLTAATNNTYRWEYSSNLSTWTNGGDMLTFGGQRWTPYLNPPTVDYATTYTYYRVKATDNYGRIKYSNIRGVAPLNLKWGRERAGLHRPGEYDSPVASGEFIMDTPGESNTSTVTLQTFLGLSRYRNTATRWTLSRVDTSRTYYPTSLSRRFRAYFRTGYTGEWTGYFDGGTTPQTYTSYGDYPDNSAAPSSDSYWTIDTLRYGGGDMPESAYGSYSNLWGDVDLRTRVEIFVFYDLQVLATTTTNSVTLYYSG